MPHLNHCLAQRRGVAHAQGRLEVILGHSHAGQDLWKKGGEVQVNVREREAEDGDNDQLS